MSKALTIYGLHAVRHALARNPDQVLELWLASGERSTQLQALETAAGTAGIVAQHADAARLARLAGSEDHQGAVARRRPPPPLGLDALLTRLAERRDTLLLVLDQVHDPHNLGACLRVADAAGADAVLVPDRHAAGLSGAVCKVASGAAERIPVVRVGNLARALKRLQEAGIWLVGTADGAEQDLYSADLTGPVALVLGNEADGLRRLTAEGCDFLVRIPMAGVCESLNVSTASAVALFEAVRQRAAAGG